MSIAVIGTPNVALVLAAVILGADSATLDD